MPTISSQTRVAPSRLAERTRELLINRPRTLNLQKIAADTGCGVRWLEMFAQQPERDSGVSKVERLYEYLSGHKLEV